MTQRFFKGDLVYIAGDLGPTITNFFGGWLASGNPWVGLGVVSFALVVNSILYYFHERVWNRIDAGKTYTEPTT